MGAFFLLSGEAAQRNDTLAQRLAREFSEQGFGPPTVFHASDIQLYLYQKQLIRNINYYRAVDGDFCACTGTLLNRGTLGLPALERLYHDFDPQRPFMQDLFGAFCVILRKAGKTFLFIDRLGIYKVYYDTSVTLFSSSLLTSMVATERPLINNQAVYEYVFEGAVHGNDTIANGTQSVSCDMLYELGKTCSVINMPGALSAEVASESMQAHLTRNLANLRRFYGHIATCFGDRIDTALSGDTTPD